MLRRAAAARKVRTDAVLCALQDLVQQNTLIEEMLHLIIMVVGESISAASPVSRNKGPVQTYLAAFCLGSRWAVCDRCRPGGAFWWGQKRNHPPVVNQTDGSQRAGEGPGWKRERPTCLWSGVYLSVYLSLYLSVRLLFQGNKETGLERVIDSVASFKSVCILQTFQLKNMSTLTTNNPPKIAGFWSSFFLFYC